MQRLNVQPRIDICKLSLALHNVKRIAAKTSEILCYGHDSGEKYLFATLPHVVAGTYSFCFGAGLPRGSGRAALIPQGVPFFSDRRHVCVTKLPWQGSRGS